MDYDIEFDLLIQQLCEDEQFLQLIQPEYIDELQPSTNADVLTKSELIASDETHDMSETSSQRANDEEPDLINMAFNDPEFQELFKNLATCTTQTASGLQVGGAINNRLYTITKTSQKRVAQFGYNQYRYELDLHISQNRTFGQAFREFSTLFQQLHTDFVKSVNPVDRIRIIFEHDLFLKPIWLSFRRPSDITPDIIMETFDHMVQSFKLTNELVQDKYNFTCDVVVINMPNGGALSQSMSDQISQHNTDEQRSKPQLRTNTSSSSASWCS